MPDEKQFEATQSRLERARREGDVARSQELAGFAAFGSAAAAVVAAAGPWGSAARAAIVGAAAHHLAFGALASLFAWTLLPSLCGAIAALGCCALQSGGIYLRALSIKLEHLSPSENLKRIFSAEAALTLMRATCAFGIASAVLMSSFATVASSALHASSVLALAAGAWSGAMRSVAAACAAAALFAVGDFALQIARRIRRLRMSSEEMKRDQKEHDGDPALRGRRRSLHRQLARGSILRVRDAAFVVANPEHLAVALEYRPPEVAVPRVVVRAAGEAALRVRELAQRFEIPIVVNVPLARMLHANCFAGDYIARDCYIAVAEIIAALRRSGALRA